MLTTITARVSDVLYVLMGLFFAAGFVTYGHTMTMMCFGALVCLLGGVGFGVTTTILEDKN